MAAAPTDRRARRNGGARASVVPAGLAGAPIDVFFLLLPDSLVLDWAGPAEALRSANRHLEALGQPARFRLHFVSPTSQSVSSVGATLSGLAPLPAALPRPSWVVLIGQPGDRLNLQTDDTRAALHWLRGLRLATGECELLCVCAGAVLAAHAGLLTHHQATTHHQHLDELAAADPQCDVQANRVFVADPPVWSSAGVTCGIDLSLQRIADLCGPAVAAQVAQSLVVPLRRGAQDAELSPFLRHRNHLHAAVHRVQDALSRAPQADWPLQRMAEVAHASPRHLSRLSQRMFGFAPKLLLQRQRFLRTLEALRAHPFPGNLRELDNLLRRLALTASGQGAIEAADVTAALAGPATPRGGELRGARDGRLTDAVELHLQRYFDLHGDQLPPPGLYDRILREIEKPLLEIALDATGGNQLRCADLLGINRNTLRKKLTDLKIEVTRRRKLM